MTVLNIDKKKIHSVFLCVVGCILLYWVLFQTQSIRIAFNWLINLFSPFIVGAVLAFILNVPMRAIENLLCKIKKPEIRRPISLILTIIAVLLILALVVGLLIPQVLATGKTFVEKLPAFFRGIETAVEKFLSDNPDLLKWVQENVKLQDLDVPGMVKQALDVVSSSVTTIVTSTFSAIGTFTSGIINAVVSIVFAIYCLFSKERLARQGRKLVYAFLPEKWGDTIVRVLRLANSTFSNFLSGQCLEVCILGSMFAISMAIFQMPYIPLVSVLVAVTAFIPIVGAFAGCILGALFILVDNPMQAVWFVAMFLVLQQIENNLIYPRVVGTSIGLPGMWVLVAVSVGGEVMGVAGMFLMIPMVAVLYVLLREVTFHRLEKRGVDTGKLEVQPPEVVSHLKAKRKKAKKTESTETTDTTTEKTE